ncbi:ThuA domain-containing protein [Pelagicoccus sp. SDUM812003]|uniref:ThuA domain-containing protein n=1 Tax=Pelagicoccus sp. SDUM812003 TaxID=3041267 RepID=UPI00280C8A85|nr:ThuA domain-containing protein [Pelagicoccus sp. SDUM812003]MDQ8202236.1 ThuA domain-containing protein [Pelagicoccus sp. SDUM812003]
METNSLGKKLMSPKAIVFGNSVAPYHPLGRVIAPMLETFEPAFDVQVVDGLSRQAQLNGSLSLIVGYEDVWKDPISDELADRLCRFVEEGGGLLLVHNGICWANHARIRSMVGACFDGHPEQEAMEYASDRAAIDTVELDVGPFTLFEEPYRYRFESDFQGTVFMTYKYEGRFWPAGWTRVFGKGRIACLQPGHRPKIFENPSYREVLRASAFWCAGIQRQPAK